MRFDQNTEGHVVGGALGAAGGHVAQPVGGQFIAGVMVHQAAETIATYPHRKEGTGASFANIEGPYSIKQTIDNPVR